MFRLGCVNVQGRGVHVVLESTNVSVREAQGQVVNAYIESQT